MGYALSEQDFSNCLAAMQVLHCISLINCLVYALNHYISLENCHSQGYSLNVLQHNCIRRVWPIHARIQLNLTLTLARLT
jgi:hypothetical protein